MSTLQKILSTLSNRRAKKPLRQKTSAWNRLVFTPLERRELLAVNVFADLNSVQNSSYPTHITEIPSMETGGIAFSAETVKGWTLVTEDVFSNRTLHTLNGAELAPTEVSHVRDSNGQDWVYFSGIGENGDRELYRLKWGTSQITLVQNINPNGSSEPKELTAVDHRLFFTAWNLATGRELWMTNSDTGETKMVGDLTPGAASSNPRELTRFVDRVYFVADSNVHGTEVFSSFGTEIKVLRNIGTGATGSDPGELTVSGLHLYFTATSPTWGREVWKSNGAHLGNLSLTNLLVDLVPNAGSSNPLELTAWNDGLAFTAEKAASGRELYRYEPNVLNTYMVKDIFPGATGSDPSELTVANGVLFFSANSPENGRELWKSQGFAANTVMIKDLNPSSSAPQNLMNAGGRVYFTAEHPSLGRELYRSDGTPESTFLARDINQGSGSSNPRNFAVANSRFFFSATNALGDDELWYSWGTNKSTKMLEIFPGTRGSAPYQLTKLGDRIAFLSNHQALTQLYATSGPGMTGTLALLAADDANFQIDGSSLRTFGNDLLFLKRSLTGADRVQLWKSDGTTAGTVLVKEILGTFLPGELFSKTVSNQTGTHFYMFLQTQPTIYKLWKSDGTADGTIQLRSAVDFQNPSSFTDVNGRLYFVAAVNNTVRRLWRSEGTNATTVSIPGLTNPHSFVAKSDQIYFFANEGSTTNFYRINQANAPTLVRRNVTGNGPGINLNGMLYFSAKVAGDNEFRLWRTTGKADQFILVKPTGVTDPTQFRIAGGKLFFTARYNTINPPAVMVTDGTAAGTITLASFSAGNQATLVGSLGNDLIYIWGNYNDGFKAARTNGTLAGTVLISEINNRFNSLESALFDSMVVGDTFYFSAIDEAFGWELFTWEP